MALETIRVVTDQRGVAYLWMSTPAKHNVLSAASISEITEACVSLGANPQVRVVVLAAEGASFCAGGDLGWMRQQIEADRGQRMRAARALATMLNALNTLPKPLIGRVQGNAFGGGVGMLSVCDVAIGVSTSKFALTEVRLGLIPATISPYVLARMGETNARRVFFSGRSFGADEAQELGLLARVVAEEELDRAVEFEVKPYLFAAPRAVARSKALARMLGPRIDEAVIAHTIEQLADTWEQDEARDGIAAFLEKKNAPWIED